MIRKDSANWFRSTVGWQTTEMGFGFKSTTAVGLEFGSTAMYDVFLCGLCTYLLFKRRPTVFITITFHRFTNPAFPYLDMEMYWSGRGQLRFRVHLKPNQQLLYLNRGSSHASSCYRAIESGVLDRLAQSTSATAANLGRPMHQLYPEHAKALQRAGLSSSRLPTLRQVLDCRSGSQGRSRSRSATKSRAVFFCLGFSKFWKTPIHLLLRRLRSKHNLLWLRVSVSYHRFMQSSRVISGAPE
jgi:hypothetical protein